ncbi:hypothetical protein FBY35_1498 [Streptomyces sp. SLBN-118]|uniref:hypothetical protein n=1 Tax=Streptomyces sp. SLBN-118 TaxID=2768454 RepID=UPI001151B684|nr:hypothetical protein [Streptomyces sp. SLBN-118]TQK51108.1 hypothetical protein FBY35_1498 [Streptomyces sp. SLBN-118]
MADAMPVRCPSCRRDHLFASPVLPCACGAPLAPPLLHAPPEPITHRTWADDWVTVRCLACGRQDHWPQPELGCPCGTVLRIPVRPVSAPGPGTTDVMSCAARPSHLPLPHTATVPRPSFRPVTIRSARDAVTAAARYLAWLGFRDVVQPEVRPSSGIDLLGPGLVAQVDTSTRPATLRDVECLWLNGLSVSATGVFFSLARYADDARWRADDLGVPLFIMDLTGSPHPVNASADELISTGA